MAIGERIQFFQTLAWYDAKNILVRLSAFPNGAQMCVWHNTKLAPVNQKQT